MSLIGLTANGDWAGIVAANPPWGSKAIEKQGFKEGHPIIKRRNCQYLIQKTRPDRELTETKREIGWAARDYSISQPRFLMHLR